MEEEVTKYGWGCCKEENKNGKESINVKMRLDKFLILALQNYETKTKV